MPDREFQPVWRALRDRLDGADGARLDRAQTEVLGFAMLFGTILLVILLVTAVASGNLLSVREDRKVANAEVAMVAFADNVDDLTRGEAPSRSTGFDLDGGRLSLGTKAVKVDIEGDPQPRHLQPLVYRAPDGTELVYLNGAVIRDDGHGQAIIDGPMKMASSERPVLTLIRFEKADRSNPGLSNAVGGDSVVSISTVRTGSKVVNGGETVTLTLESVEATAWGQNLDEQDGITYDAANDAYTVDTATVTVVIIDIDVRFD